MGVRIGCRARRTNTGKGGATKPTGGRFPDKLTRVFMPAEGRIGRLVMRWQGGSQALVEVWLGKKRAIRALFSNHTKSPESAKVLRRKWPGAEVSSVYIPVKEMLANAPGFRSLYAERAIHFEEIYRDVLDRAYLLPLLGAPDAQRHRILGKLRRVLKGTVRLKNEESFLAGARGRLEFALLAEGLRKFGLLWLLVQNGTLLEGSVLFWDEPESEALRAGGRNSARVAATRRADLHRHARLRDPQTTGSASHR